MKIFKSTIAPISFIILFMLSFSSCTKFDLKQPWEEKNEMLEGSWEAVKYILDDKDLSAIVKSITIEFTPSEIFPKEGKYETFLKGESQDVSQYIISDDGERIIMEGEEHKLEVNESTLILTKEDYHSDFKTLELVMIRS